MTAPRHGTRAATTALANQIRSDVVEMTGRSGASHVGTALSIADIVGVLYGSVLRVDADAPEEPLRDRFILSKGHGCAAVYSALATQGFFPRDWLDSFYMDEGRLFGHITSKGVPGVEVSTGALGHGLPIATGMGIWGQRRDLDYRIYTLMSDGDCDEGSTWEAAMLAGHHGLRNLVGIVDYNRLQSLGTTDNTVSLDPLPDKWRAFGWDVVEIDGHDHDAIEDALRASHERPLAIVAHTTKGHGIPFMENEVLWHYRAPQGEELEAARAALEARS